MRERLANAVPAAVRTLLRPLVRILLRNGIPYRSFADLAKRVYVEVAASEFGLPGRKQSKSRVAILTGLTRKEVLRVMSLPEPSDEGARERYNRAARVVAGWVRDPGFGDGSGNPAPLAVDGNGTTFADLVRRYSGDAPARAVLDELVRVGAAERSGEGKVRLLERSYVPRTSGTDKIAILGADAADLIATVDHNIRRPEEAYFQRKSCYDNLPEEAMEELRRLVREEAQRTLERFDRWLSERDRDVNPAVGGTGRKRAGVGIYYFESEPGGGGP